MPKLSRAVPKYRHHKRSNQACVVIGGNEIYLGVFGTAASHSKYDQVIAEFLTNGRSLRRDEPITVIELAAEFSTHLASYYVKDGELTSEQSECHPVQSQSMTPDTNAAWLTVSVSCC